MGGSGSGRIGEKNLTSQMMELDVQTLHRHGFFRKVSQLSSNIQLESRNESKGIQVVVTAQQLSISYLYEGFSGDREPVSIIIKFDWTPCHYGGRRPWFLCPKCGRRVAILYGGKYFHCRLCRNLAYPNENESPAFRMLQKANKIKRRLNCEPGVQNRILFKPKGMHQKTFDRLLTQVHMLENIAVKQLYQNQTRNQDLQ